MTRDTTGDTTRDTTRDTSRATRKDVEKCRGIEVRGVEVERGI